ncbi:hypothetical protein ABG768_008453 [Culter alburnus]|uniref:Uncharacterized protein n=1 Tax=Culter alburnus TaxID=194366 RepID=A0AAW1ZKM6_CULAL
MGCPAACLIETQKLEPTRNNITSSCQLQPGNKSAFPRLCCREHDSARRKKAGPSQGHKGSSRFRTAWLSVFTSSVYSQMIKINTGAADGRAVCAKLLRTALQILKY